MSECVKCGGELPEDRIKQCAPCDAEIAAEIAARESRDREGRAERELMDSGLPRAYRTGERTLSHLPLSKIGDAMQAAMMLGKQIRGIYLHGGAGEFKTSFACSLLASQIRSGARGRYVYVPELFARIYAGYDAVAMARGGMIPANVPTRYEIVADLVNAPCLVLDDIGKEVPNTHAANVMAEALDGRYRNTRADFWMIVTSNYDLDGLCNRYGKLGAEVVDPMRRRISEMTISVGIE